MKPTTRLITLAYLNDDRPQVEARCYTTVGICRILDAAPTDLDQWEVIHLPTGKCCFRHRLRRAATDVAQQIDGLLPAEGELGIMLLPEQCAEAGAVVRAAYAHYGEHEVMP